MERKLYKQSHAHKDKERQAYVQKHKEKDKSIEQTLKHLAGSGSNCLSRVLLAFIRHPSTNTRIKI